MMSELPQPIIEKRMFKCRNCDAVHDFANPCADCPNGNWKKEFCAEKKLNPLELIGRYMKLNPDDPKLEKKTEIKNFLENVFNGKPKSGELPKMSEMAKNLLDSSVGWMRSGFVATEKEILEKRIETCRGCEFWNPKGFRNTGRCMKCGCSTWAKLRMATEKCPIGKW